MPTQERPLRLNKLLRLQNSRGATHPFLGQRETLCQQSTLAHSTSPTLQPRMCPQKHAQPSANWSSTGRGSTAGTETGDRQTASWVYDLEQLNLLLWACFLIYREVILMQTGTKFHLQGSNTHMLKQGSWPKKTPTYSSPSISKGHKNSEKITGNSRHLES